MQRFIAGQFRRPSGPLGLLRGRLMDRGNAPVVEACVPAPGDRIDAFPRRPARLHLRDQAQARRLKPLRRS